MFGKTNEPVCGFDKKPCVRERCVQWVLIRGRDPLTGNEIDKPGCAIAWLPILMIETAKEVRQAAGAIESQRNAVAGVAVAAAAEVIERAAKSAMIGGPLNGRLPPKL